MSYEARVFRVLIASPSDVEDERDIAVKTIQDWNDLNSPERQIVLLPLRWETHTAPEYGKRPQEIINKQMVDHCDLLIGIFWTRIGSPTGAENSGTLEEIYRVASAGKPVMLYFSKVKKTPDEIDVKQLEKLRQFKTNTYPKALIETYSSQIEFRDKLSKQIEMQLRNLLTENRNGVSGKIESDIILEFAETGSHNNLGIKTTLKSTYFNLSGIDKLPDFISDNEDNDIRDNTKENIVIVGSERTNKDYFRDMAEYLVTENMFKPINFWLKNVGSLGAKDLYVDITVSASVSDVKIFSPDKFDITRPRKKSGGGVYIASSSHFYKDRVFSVNRLEGREGEWKITHELRALQPKREICPDLTLFIGAKNSGELSFNATIYADSLPEPIHHSLTLNLEVDVVEINANRFLQEHGELSIEKSGKNANKANSAGRYVVS